VPRAHPAGHRGSGEPRGFEEGPGRETGARGRRRSGAPTEGADSQGDHAQGDHAQAARGEGPRQQEEQGPP